MIKQKAILFDVTENAQKIFKVGCDMPWRYRISANVHTACNDEEEKINKLLNAGREAIRNANERVNPHDSADHDSIEFTCKIGRKNLRLWVVSDSKRPAINFITPEEY